MAILSGITRRSAAAIAGFSESTLYTWIARGKELLAKVEEAGEEGEKPSDEASVLLLEFLEALWVSEAELEKKLVGAITAEDPKFILARRFRRDWGNSLEVVERTGEEFEEVYQIEFPDHQLRQGGEVDGPGE